MTTGGPGKKKGKKASRRGSSGGSGDEEQNESSGPCSDEGRKVGSLRRAGRSAQGRQAHASTRVSRNPSALNSVQPHLLHGSVASRKCQLHTQMGTDKYFPCHVNSKVHIVTDTLRGAIKFEQCLPEVLARGARCTLKSGTWAASHHRPEVAIQFASTGKQSCLLCFHVPCHGRSKLASA
eukprot:1158037-Pelagomonas_calceolata.AAC.1